MENPNLTSTHGSNCPNYGKTGQFHIGLIIYLRTKSQSTEKSFLSVGFVAYTSSNYYLLANGFELKAGPT